MTKIERLLAILTILSFVPVLSPAQTSTENYVMTETMLDANEANTIKSVQYFNGLGNPTVSVVTSGGNGETAYSLTAYDAIGREECKYLPVATDYSFDYKSPSAIMANSGSFYDNDGTAYTINHYDALDRVTSTELPGVAWRNADKRMQASYDTNLAQEVLHYEAHVGLDSLVKPENASYEYYPAGTLTKETRQDADGKKTETFRDLYGNVVLQRVDNTLCTYYVYDEVGQLRYVLSPEYQKHGKKAIFGYEYRYDNRGRLVKKILPGAEYIQYWYDDADRLVCIQDGVMRTTGNKHRFMVYDGMGRVVIQGLCSGYSHNAGVTATATYGNASGFLGTGYVIPSALASALSNPQIEMVNYYDSYDFLSDNPYSCFSGMNVTTAVSQMGRQTGSITAAGNGEYLPQVMVYDIKGNLIEKKTRELGGRTVTQQMSYTFTNNVASVTCTAGVGYGSSLTLSETMQYNTHNDKRQSSTLSVSHGGDAASSTMTYGYDALGRLSRTTRPFTTAVDPDVTYTYDLHGWLTGITTHSFSEELFYAGGPGTPCYNGNISSVRWTDKKSPQKRGYMFTYDDAGRLTQGTYGEGDALTANSGRFSEGVQYDANGNVTSIARYGKTSSYAYGLMDSLTLSYDGNRLTGVTEAAADYDVTGSFEYKRARGSEYLYNSNGSLVADKSRGIVYITYDGNGNPSTIYFVNGNVTRYLYSASGQKLRAVYYTAMPYITRTFGVKPPELEQWQTQYADSTDYLLGGSLVMKNGRIDKCYFEGGYARAMSTGSTTDRFVFYYYNRDHLGNNREVVDQKARFHQVTSYYPFGAPYADAAALLGTDLQPYKYNGKELDTMHGLNTYDYGARQYDPILARWDRVDPLAEKYYNVSPYVYCGNNPVMLVDPDGKEIFMVGSYKQRMELLGFLQQLSNDELAMKQNGQVFIKKTGNRNSGQNLNLGTELVASVLNHHHIVTIQSTMKNSRTHSVYRGNSTNGKGTDVNIFVNPKKPVNTLVRNNKTGKSVYETTPTYITLGHELVHSLHNINGTAKDHDDKSEYIFMDIDGLMKKTKARTEELETTGIIGNSEISENKLREEHNLNLRIHY